MRFVSHCEPATDRTRSDLEAEGTDAESGVRPRSGQVNSTVRSEDRSNWHSRSTDWALDLQWLPTSPWQCVGFGKQVGSSLPSAGKYFRGKSPSGFARPQNNEQPETGFGQHCHSASQSAREHAARCHVTPGLACQCLSDVIRRGDVR